MAESVLNRALRGLGNMLQLSGAEREAPPGIELGRPAIPVFDLTAIGRYGSAQVFGHRSDGWVIFAINQANSLAAVDAINVIWNDQIATAFETSKNRIDQSVLWCYDISLSATGAAADIGASHMAQNTQIGISLAGTRAAMDKWFNDGTVGFQRTATTHHMIQQANPYFPFVMPANEAATFGVTNENANLVTWRWSLLCRMLPRGVPPLP